MKSWKFAVLSSVVLLMCSLECATAQSLPFPPPGGWTNLRQRFDVNADGTVTAIDSLLVINYLNGNTNTEHVDVNGDGFITAIDALMVINFLNTPNPPAYNTFKTFDANVDASANSADYQEIEARLKGWFGVHWQTQSKPSWQAPPNFKGDVDANGVINYQDYLKTKDAVNSVWKRPFLGALIIHGQHAVSN